MLKYIMGTVKICGITNLEDASAAVEYGANALGFIFHPESPRSVTPDTAKKIISSMPPFITTVGVFVDRGSPEVCEIASYSGINVIQLHGSESPEDYTACRKVIKAVHVKELADLEPIKCYESASAILLDTYSPDLAGGTGQIFNWEIAVEAKKLCRIILAGGLTPENVGEAIRLVRPYGVDVASGVESDNPAKKDHKKLSSFIERAKEAFIE
jgi:phosphoribosylanthranilate isomerase